MTPLPRLELRRWLTAAVVGLGLGLSTLVAAPATADEASDAPVTAPDRVTVWAGGSMFSGAAVDVLANDTDPQGDKLEVCRVGPSASRYVEASAFMGSLSITVRRRAKAGTYVLTYYACDFDYLTPGTVTVTVKKAKRIRVAKIPGRPGKLRVVNPNSRRVVVLWGSQDEEKPDGQIRLGGHKRAVITVTRERVFWFAYFPRIFVLVGQGTVRGITLPKRAASERAAAVPPRAGHLWDAHR
jgi:hypothetical protein